MLLRSWLAGWRQRSLYLLHGLGRPRPPRQRPADVRINTEVLEVRCVPTTINLASLGSGGTTIYGADAGDESGRAVSNAGDVNGDGFDDLIIGALHAAALNNAKANAGECYIIFGSANPTQTLDLAALGSAGVVIFGADAGDIAGYSVGRAGDVNGDGFDDVLIGAPGGDAASNAKSSAGDSYLIFGKATFPATIDLTSLGTGGMKIYGPESGDGSGTSVSSAGDMNGDGYDDLVIGAEFGDGSTNTIASAGEVYVFYGRAAPPTTLDFASSNLGCVTIFGIAATDNAGATVSSAGDVNGDGLDDLLIGAPGFDNGLSGNFVNTGEAFVVFGNLSLPSTINLASLGTAGITIVGASPTDSFGTSVSGAGDVNGDGFDDLIVGAPHADGGTSGGGTSYVIFGSSTPPTTITLSTPGSAGMTIFGARNGELDGTSVSGLGDVNGDGYDDLIIGSYFGTAPGGGSWAGASFVIFGAASLPATLDLAIAGSAGIAIYGIDSGDQSGKAVSRAGDVNGDGFADILVGGESADAVGNVKSDAGESYIILGGNFTNSVTRLGTSAGQTLTGTTSADVINGAGGNDLLVGLGGADVIYGGQGDDVITVTDLTFKRLDGGNGSDTLTLDGTGITLDLTALPDSVIANIETIDIRGTGPNTITLNSFEVRRITGNSNPAHTSNTLTIRTNYDDTVNKGTGWTLSSSTNTNGVLHKVYTLGTATLVIDIEPRTTIQLSTLGTAAGVPGLTIFGADPNDESGFAVSNAGDVNGDGFDDILIGAIGGAGQNNTVPGAGESYLVFGGPGLPATIDLANLGNAGVTIFGIDSTVRTGWALSSAGDVNGDGFSDIILGAFNLAEIGGHGPHAGASYLIFGGASLPATIDLENLGTAGVTIHGADNGDLCGYSVSNAGDINGDGFDDVMISALQSNGSGNAHPYAGETYVIYGKADWSASSTIELASLGSAGVTIFGAQLGDQSGISVSNAGDINGDGFADLLIGSAFGSLQDAAGEAYVVFGGPALPASIDLESLGSAGFRIAGVDYLDQAGRSVSSAGDMNGDGFGDLIVGALYADAAGNAKGGAGETYVIFGKADWSSTPTVSLGSLGAGGMTILGPSTRDYSGRWVSDAGDVNGDGFDDMLIGAPGITFRGYSETSAGTTYLIFGSATLPATIDLANLGFDGIAIQGVEFDDHSGWAVSGAGDVNGDGFDDMLVGAKFAYAAGNAKFIAGETYVIYGGDFKQRVTHLGTSVGQTLTGTTAANFMNGAGGNDILVGNGGADVILGGSGDDVLAISTVNFQRLDGGNGFDTLRLDGAGLTLDLTALADNKLTGIDYIDVRGSGSNVLKLNYLEVLNLTANSNPAHTSNVLSVYCGYDDTVNIGSGWTEVSNTIVNGDQYQTFTQGAATLLLKTYIGQFDLEFLGTAGTTILGADAGDYSGISMSHAGDINGDGFDDVIVGAHSSSGLNNGKSLAGETYVIFGSATPLATIDLANLGSAGMIIYGVDVGDRSGGSVSRAGDVNGDGFDDLIIGAPYADASGNNKADAGESYVIFGNASLPATISLASLGSAGFTIFGADAGDQSGTSVSSAGDVNGDGYDDVIIGALYADASGNAKANAGESYVIFGKATFPATIDLASLGTAGTKIYGADAGDLSGCAVAGAGDVNGDGYDDLIIGASAADGSGNSKNGAGETALVFGKASMPSTIDLASLGTAGVTIFGIDSGDVSGISVAGVGDVNGDWFDDILIGAVGADGPSDSRFGGGESYVIFGAASLPTTISLSTLGNAGVTILGVEANDQSGRSVSSAGDVNSDGYDDMLIGANTSKGLGNAESLAGESYLIYGGAALPNTIDLATPNAAGIILFGANISDNSGLSVSGGGDVNGDGFDDLLIGAPGGDAAGNSKAQAGESYIVFGGNFTNSAMQLGTSAANTLIGTTAASILVGGAGNDTLNSPGAVLYGGIGDDTLLVDNLDSLRIDGGYGSDTLVLDDSDRSELDLTTLGHGQLTGIEVFDITQSDHPGLILNLRTVLELTSNSNPAHTAHTLIVRRSTAQFVLGQGLEIGPGWTFAGTESINSVPYTVYTQGAATLKVTQKGPTFYYYPSSVPENTTLAGTFQSLDSDHTSTFPGTGITHSITGGADQSKFSITSGGTLSFVTAPDYENPTDVGANNVYEVEITATDSRGIQSIATFGIRVTAVNEFAPVFTSSATFSVVENTSSVGTVVATDADKPTPTITYSLTGGADQAKFAVNISSGALIFLVSPNFDSPSDAGANNVYDVQVTASDGSKTTAQNIAVTVTGVNDNAPVFTTGAAINVAENSTAVGTIVATDADQPAQTITYSLTGGVDQAKFSITSGGVLTFITAPDYENPDDSGANRVYNLQITADDGNGFATNKSFTITVTAVNDNSPVFTSGTTFNVAENTLPVVLMSATDADLPAQTITFSVVGGADQAKFTVTSGILRFLTAPNFEAPSDVGANNVYDVQVRANDGNGGLTLQNIAVTVTPVNDNAPVFTSSANINVAENATAVVTLTATDADLPAQTVTYSITGGVDQAKFSLVGSALSFIAPPNFESPTDVGTNNVYNLQVTANDGSGSTTIQNIAVTVTAVNDNLPVFTSPATYNVLENTTAIGTMTATDADLPAQTISYSLTGGVDQAKFSVTSGGVLKFIAGPDFEQPGDAGANNVYDLQVTASDANGGLTVQNIAVTVNNINDAPVFTSSATFNVLENTTAVGTVLATDADVPSQTVTYSITGGADQNLFTLSAGGLLQFIAAPDFENPGDAGANNVYNLQVTADDGQGGVTTQNIAVTVINDVIPPGLVITPGGFLSNAASFTFTFEFSKPVTGFTAGDIVLTNGSGSQFTVIDSDTYTLVVTPIADGAVLIAVGANAAQDIDSNGSLAANTSFTSDRTGPLLSITPNATTVSANPITFTFQFSETVSGFTASDVTITNGTAGTFTVVDGDTYTLQVVPGSVGLVTVDVGANAVQDVATNGNAATSASITSDPNAVTLSITPNGTVTNATTILFTFQFNVSVTGFTAGDVNLTNGTAGTFTVVDGDTYTLQVTPVSNTTVTVNVGANAAQDAFLSGNVAASATVVSDRVLPGVGITPSGVVTNASPILFTFQFTEPVSGFAANDVSLTNGTAGTFTVVDADTYTLQVSPTADGTVTVSVGANAAQDVATNGSTAASVSVTSDRTAPTLSITPNGTTTNASSVLFTFQFSEAVTGFTAGNISILNGTAGTFAAVDGDTYTLVVTPTAPGTVTVNVGANAAQDVANNGNAGASAAIISDPNAVTLNITPSGTTTNATSLTFTFQFNVGMTGFAANDIVLTNGSAGTFTVIDGDTYTLQVTPTADGAVTVSVAANVAQDAIGDGNISATATVTSDRTVPNLTITPNSLGTNVSPITFTFQFTETVNGFTVGDISLTNGTAGTFTAVDGDTYTLLVTPNADGAVSVSVAANIAQDAGTNGNTAASASVTSDRTVPGLSITPNNVTTNVSAILFTFQFTETVTGFTAGDVSLTNGTAGLFTAVDGDTFTLIVTPVANGTVTASVAANVALDAVTNGNLAASASVISDRTAPGLTITPNAILTNASSVLFTFQFTETVSSFTAGDISVTNGVAGTFTPVDGDTYTLAVTPSADGTVTVSVAANAALDDAVNGSAAASASVTSDRTVPSLTITPNGTVTNASSLTFTFQFSQVVNGFTAGDISLTNGTAGTFTAVDGDTYTLQVTPIADGAVTASVSANAAQDAATNGNPAASATVTSDRTLPGLNITPNATTTNAAQITFTFQFTESVTGFAANDVALTNAIAGTFTAVDGDTYTLVVTPNSDGLVAVNVAANAAQDTATNGSTAASASVTSDRTVPGLTITPNGGPSNASPITFTFQFTEAVTGFMAGDISLTNATAGTFTAVDGDTYTLLVTPAGDGAVTVSVAANAAQDVATNGNTSASASVTSDRTVPGLTITPNATLTNASPILFTLQFTESVSGFTVGDIGLTNGSAGTFTAVDGDTYTLQVVPASNGIVAVSVAANVAQDVAANGNTAASASLTSDRSLPTATITSVSPNPRTTAVGSLTITFSEPVTGFGLSDLSLTRDGGANLFTGSQTLTSSDNVTFTLGNLSPLTGSVGSYTLRLVANGSGIQDAAGNAMLADASEAWARVNPTVTLSLNNPSIAETGGTATVTATLSAITDVDVTVTLGFTGAAAFPADYSRSATQIVIPAGSLSNSVLLTAVSDGDLETTELIVVDITGVTNGVETGSQQVATQIVDDDHSPVFTSSTAVSVTENSIVALTVTATDADVPAQTITYSISGGPDQSRFTITGTGVLKFITAPNFETPADTGFNNVYNVQIRANDGHGGQALQNVAITVTDLDESAPTVSLNPVSPDPRNSPVDSITIVFSEAVNGFDLGDLSLTRSGGASNLLTGSMSLTTQDNITYILGGLSSVTSQGGIYLFTVTADGAGIVDTTGNPLVSGASDGWTTDATLPTATITEVSPSPRLTAVSELTIVFSEAVSEFDLSDLSLTRDGGTNLLTGSESLTSTDNVTFTLGNLIGLTGAVGDYTLTLHGSASAIHDSVGNLMATDAVESWSRVSPTVSLSINHSTFSEAAGTATVTATLSAATDVNVTVVLGFSGSTTFPGDFSRGATQITILAGNTTGSITLTGIQDSQFEGPESIVVDIESVTNGEENGTQQVTTQVIDDDHAPAFVTTATPSVPENSTLVLTVIATDADVPAQTVTYSITGGIDRDLFALTAAGELRFQSPPNFEVPTDSDFNNTYEVQVTADDGHGGTTVQNLTVTVTNVAEAPTLVLGGPDVTWIRKQPPVTILPQITVGGASNLAGGTLTINVNAIGTPKKLMDVFHIPSFASLGTSSGPRVANGHLTLEVSLGENATTSAVQSFLRGLTFMTKGKGLKVLTRTMAVTLADHTGATGSVTQTINVRKH